MVGFGKLTDRPIAANGFNMIDLKMLLDDLYRGATENTGNEPSVSVFHRAFNELKSYVLRMESKLAELEKLEKLEPIYQYSNMNNTELWTDCNKETFDVMRVEYRRIVYAKPKPVETTQGLPKEFVDDAMEAIDEINNGEFSRYERRSLHPIDAKPKESVDRPYCWIGNTSISNGDFILYENTSKEDIDRFNAFPVYRDSISTTKPQRITEQDALDLIEGYAYWKDYDAFRDISIEQFFKEESGKILLDKLNEHREPEAKPSASIEPECKTCGGRGEVISSHRIAVDDYIEEPMTCPVCNGDGSIAKHVQDIQERYEKCNNELHALQCKIGAEMLFNQVTANKAEVPKLLCEINRLRDGIAAITKIQPAAFSNLSDTQVIALSPMKLIEHCNNLLAKSLPPLKDGAQ